MQVRRELLVWIVMLVRLVVKDCNAGKDSS